MSSGQIVRSHDPSTFLHQTGQFLYAHEPEYHPIVGAIEGLHRGLGNPVSPLLIHGEQGGQVIGLLVGTDSRLHISEWREENTGQLDKALLQLKRPIKNLIGPADTVNRLIPGRFRTVIEQRALSAEKIKPPEAVPGVVRLANAQDISLVSQWLLEYSAQSKIEIRIEAQQTRQFVMNQVNRQLVYLWCMGGRPVSMAQLGTATKNGISITAVFTPQKFRGNGYASNLVAEVSQRMLKKYRFCVLRTEVTNKTSNKIYESIGYEPVADLKSCYF